MPCGSSIVPLGPTATAAAAWSWVLKMLQEHQRTCAPSVGTTWVSLRGGGRERGLGGWVRDGEARWKGLRGRQLGAGRIGQWGRSRGIVGPSGGGSRRGRGGGGRR